MAFCFALVAAALLRPSPAHAESPKDIIIFVNLSTPVKALSKEDIRDYFLKKRLNWNGGVRAVPIHAKSGSGLRDDFLRLVMGMTTAQEEAYWRDFNIRTGVTTPAVFSNTLKAVFKLEGGISYCYRADYKDGVVKIVLVIPEK